LRKKEFLSSVGDVSVNDEKCRIVEDNGCVGKERGARKREDRGNDEEWTGMGTRALPLRGVPENGCSPAGAALETIFRPAGERRCLVAKKKRGDAVRKEYGCAARRE
jgi:hypothetical protein